MYEFDRLESQHGLKASGTSLEIANHFQPHTGESASIFLLFRKRFEYLYIVKHPAYKENENLAFSPTTQTYSMQFNLASLATESTARVHEQIQYTVKRVEATC